MGEYRQFPGIAQASNFELQAQLEIARALEMGDPRRLDQAEGFSREAGKMLYAAIQSMKKPRMIGTN